MCGTTKWHFISHFYEGVFLTASALMSRPCRGTPQYDEFFAPAQSPGTVEVHSWRSLELLEVRSPLTLDPDMTVDEIMRRWPATIRVFIRNRMLCIGCPIGVFHTVKDACDAHCLDRETFARELLAAMKSDDLASGPSVFEAGGNWRSGAAGMRCRQRNSNS